MKLRDRIKELEKENARLLRLYEKAIKVILQEHLKDESKK